ncbi:ATP-dependent DNA helicase PIF1-like protein [Tanacetum coccineum]
MTVNKKLYSTCKAACFAYGMLNDNKEWAHAIKEAAFWALAPQLCDLFVTILLFYDVSRPLHLWEQTWELLSKDILCKKRKLFKLRSKRQIVLAMASSGITSLLLPGGRTAHSRFIIQLELILPVISKGKRAEIVQACINCSELWKSYKFNKWVLDVGDEIVEAKKEDEDEPTCIEILEDFIINAAKSPIEQIVNETFPNFTTKKSDGAYLKERAILTPRNNDADAINAYMFSKFPSPTITYNNTDEVCKASTDVLEKQHLYPTEFLNTLNFLGMPPHALNLKKELPIMLLRNVNLSQGLCNGTHLIIMDLGQFVLRA